jgi:hypothetical protein
MSGNLICSPEPWPCLCGQPNDWFRRICYNCGKSRKYVLKVRAAQVIVPYHAFFDSECHAHLGDLGHTAEENPIQ